MQIKSIYAIACGLLLLCFMISPAMAQASVDPSAPAQPVKLIFIHHSTGENWLSDEQGGLGRALEANNYFVSDTNYGWGPDGIGDRTDIVNWQEWFRSPQTPQIMQAVYQESEVHSPYTRTMGDPGGENQIVMFKSCFPNSGDMGGSPNDPPTTPDGSLTVGTAKGVYNDLLEYFKTRPDKLFVVITAPPVQDRSNAANARAFNTWLLTDWLREANYPYANVAVWDFYNILTGQNHHHRINNGQVEYTTNASDNTLVYPSEDDHPNPQGSRKATDEFVPMLNSYYNRWQSAGGAAAAPAEPAAQPAPQEETQPEQQPAPQEVSQPPAAGTNALDDFEGASPANTDGWVVYFDESPETTIACGPQTKDARNSKSSLQIDFKVGNINGWATCSLEFREAQNWSAFNGLEFWMQSSEPGLPYGVSAQSGTRENRETYALHTSTDEQSAKGWTYYFVPWQDIRRVDWEDNPGTPLNPSNILGIAFTFAGVEGGVNTGTLYIDDLKLSGGAAQPEAVQPEAQVPEAGVPAAVPPPASTEAPQKKPSLRNLCPLNAALPVGLVLAALWGASRRKKQA